MMQFVKRRKINWAVLLVTVAVTSVWIYNYHNQLKVSEYLSGWLLSFAIFLLGLYGVRKKLTTLPLFSNSIWLQLHLYTGLLAIWLFMLHTSWSLPSGALQIALYAFFILISFTGLLGIMLSRQLPPYLRREGDEVIYERIPEYRVSIQKEAEQLLVELVSDQRETSLQKYYLAELHSFFSNSGDFFTYILRSRSYLSGILNQLIREERYFNEREREFSSQIQTLIQRKYQLELHYVYQSILKYWLFVHVPFTYGMYLIILMHILASYGFRGAIG